MLDCILTFEKVFDNIARAEVFLISIISIDFDFSEAQTHAHHLRQGRAGPEGSYYGKKNPRSEVWEVRIDLLRLAPYQFTP